MNKPYYIRLDFKNKQLKKLALAYILSNSFIKRCVITEVDITQNRLMPLMRHDLFIFDDKFADELEATAFCREYLRKSPETIFVHIGVKQFEEKTLPIISISRKLFIDKFIHIIGFCFLTHMVRTSIVNVKTFMKK